MGPRQPILISETARSLRQIATDERMLEEARIAARKERSQNPTSKPQTPGRDESAHPSPIGLVAPEPGEKKLSAKETRKINQSKIAEADSHRNANATASLMLGSSKKKKYAWLDTANTPSPPI